MSSPPVQQDSDSVPTSSSSLFFKKKRKTPSNLKSRTPIPPDHISAEDKPDTQPDSADEHLSDSGSNPTIEEIIALRKLRKSRGGIDLERLNAGQPKKKKKKRNTKGVTEGEEPIDQPDVEGYEMQDDSVRKDDKIDEDEPEDEDARTRKIIKSNNFTQQTNTLDVDKHMMRYIEEELKLRRKAAIAAGADESSEPILTGAEAVASLDPRDELYKIAEKYRIDKKPVVEGNVTLSATMLTSIPEVDLGIDTRIKNIEATEKAKRKLADERLSNSQSSRPSHSSSVTADANKEHFAADRFLLPNHLKQHNWASDVDSLQIARLENEGLSAEAEAMRKDMKKRAYQLKYGNNNHHGGTGQRNHGAKGTQVATDDRAVENFRKRMGGRR
ncbi:hepatocellular carcinoma-associated antigen 59-domain-containing protein [Melampsora americana]|nr:hepatocellular carcinoma-associated antigen 59-domain-containing protein [Melampsora americana]